MKSCLCKISAVLLLIASTNYLAAQKLVFKEDFESDINALEAKGWLFKKALDTEGINLISSLPVSGNQSLEIRSKGVNYAYILIPVEPGKRYYGSVKMRCSNVRDRKLTNPAVQRNRGAVMFFQLSTKDKKHLNGGSFPRGLKGTGETWVLHEVKETKPMPARVKYINLTIGVEGVGTAVFDDIAIYEMPEKISIVSPAPDQEVKNEQLTLKWRPKLVSAVKLSRDPLFPVEKTFTLYDIKGDGEVKVDFDLSKGKWYWLVDARPAMNDLAKSSFVVENITSLNNARVSELWKNEFTSPQPELKFQVFPYQKKNKVKVEIDGKEAPLKDFGNGVYSFVPARKIVEKVYCVEITVNGKTSKFIYSTTKRKTKISFRKDNTMLIDGKPFFPIGAYRDPSDWLIFTGVKEAGFNMSHSYYFEEKTAAVEKARKYLKEAEKNGVKIFMGISRKKIKTADEFWIKYFCASLKSSRALITWYLFDEPIDHRIPIFTLGMAMNSLRDVDPQTPISVLFTASGIKNVENMELYRDLRLANIFWVDSYPVEKDIFDAKQYYERHLEAKKAAGNRPFWAVVQGSDLNVYPRAKTKKVKYPTALQSRVMAHSLLAAGADGLIWYWGPKTAYHIKNDAPHVWKGICETTREINKLAPYLVGDRTKIKLSVPENIQYWSAKNESKQIVSIINLSHKPVKAKIKFPKPAPEKLNLFESDKTLALDNGTLDISLNAYEVKIFSWGL
jgi:hypothetical protein